MTSRHPLSAHRARVPQSVVTRVVDGATVLLNTESGRYFTLDEAGTAAWAALTSAASLQQALDRLLAEYESVADELRQDLDALVDSLVREGLLEVVSV